MGRHFVSVCACALLSGFEAALEVMLIYAIVRFARAPGSHGAQVLFVVCVCLWVAFGGPCFLVAALLWCAGGVGWLLYEAYRWARDACASLRHCSGGGGGGDRAPGAFPQLATRSHGRRLQVLPREPPVAAANDGSPSQHEQPDGAACPGPGVAPLPDQMV